MSAETVVDQPPATEVPKAEPPPKVTGGAALVKIADRGIVLSNLDDLLRFARLIVEGGAAPEWAFARVPDKAPPDQSVRIASGAVAIAIQVGLEHGLGLLGGLQAFIVLDGHISWRGEAAAAKIRNSPVCVTGSLKFWCEGEGAQIKGVAVAHRVGYSDPDRREFTYRDAAGADLLKKWNWKNYAKRMYQWRALAWLSKDVFSDLLGGFPLAEDVQDYERRPEKSAAASVVDRARLSPPPAPDPLMAELGLFSAKPAAQQTVEVPATPVHTEVVPAAATADPSGLSPLDLGQAPAAPDPAPTFPTESDLQRVRADVAEAEILDRAAAPAPGCTHPAIPPSRLEPGKTVVCPDCGEELTLELTLTSEQG